MKKSQYNVKTLEIPEIEGSYTIDPKVINVNYADNPRLDYGIEDFQELKMSIKENGIETALLVYINQNDGTVHLRHGFRRMKALLELIDEGVTFEKIKVINTEKYDKR